jgi:hypothetical protein
VDDSDHRTGHSNSGPSVPIVNTHIHLPPNFSAFASADEAIQLAASDGVTVVGTANYHDFRVYRRFASAAEAAGIVPLFGVEIIALIEGRDGRDTLVNDPTNLNRMYLCGKGLTRIDPPPSAAARRMAAMRAASDSRIQRMTNLVAAQFGRVGLDGGWTADRIAESVAKRCAVPIEWVALQERHVAQAFQELLFREVAPAGRAATLGSLFESPVSLDTNDALQVQEAIRSNLLKAGKPAFVPEAAVSFDGAYRLILELGGIPCYPILADGASPICGFEDPPEALVERLLGLGIYCAELIPVRNRPEVVDRYVTALRRAGIVVMAGTEHNTQRMIPLHPTALDGKPLSETARDAFWEATCIVAAHQELSKSGRAGYVDRNGTPVAGFADGEARIRHFRDIGADLIGNRSASRIQA